MITTEIKKLDHWSLGVSIDAENKRYSITVTKRDDRKIKDIAVEAFQEWDKLNPGVVLSLVYVAVWQLRLFGSSVAKQEWPREYVFEKSEGKVIRKLKGWRYQ